MKGVVLTDEADGVRFVKCQAAVCTTCEADSCLKIWSQV